MPRIFGDITPQLLCEQLAIKMAEYTSLKDPKNKEIVQKHVTGNLFELNFLLARMNVVPNDIAEDVMYWLDHTFCELDFGGYPLLYFNSLLRHVLSSTRHKCTGHFTELFVLLCTNVFKRTVSSVPDHGVAQKEMLLVRDLLLLYWKDAGVTEGDWERMRAVFFDANRDTTEAEERTLCSFYKPMREAAERGCRRMRVRA